MQVRVFARLPKDDLINGVGTALLVAIGLASNVVPPPAMAEVSLSVDNARKIRLEAQDEPLGSILREIHRQSGITFSMSESLAAEPASASVTAQAWDDLLKRLLNRYNTAFLWDANNRLYHVNLLRTGESDDSMAITERSRAPSGPPLLTVDDLNPGTADAPPGAHVNESEQYLGPPANHEAGPGPPIHSATPQRPSTAPIGSREPTGPRLSAGKSRDRAKGPSEAPGPN